MLGISYIINTSELNNVELAEKLGCSRKLISEWTSGRKPISVKRLKQLSDIFEIPQPYFTREISEQDKIDIHILRLIQMQKDNIEYLYNEQNEKIGLKLLF